jgi:hypothetical protein
MTDGTTARICMVDVCETREAARGYCSTHYSRWRTKGDPGPAYRLSQIVKGHPCIVDGCKRDAYARGYCAMHYRRWRTKGDPGPAWPQDYRYLHALRAEVAEYERRYGPLEQE